MSDEGRKDRGVTRLSFLKASAGAAAGAAAIGVPSAAVIADQGKGVETEATTAVPREPVMAYVRDAKRGEVTVVSGTSEATYLDRSLTRRLLDAAPENPVTNGGASDVLAP